MSDEKRSGRTGLGAELQGDGCSAIEASALRAEVEQLKAQLAEAQSDKDARYEKWCEERERESDRALQTACSRAEARDTLIEARAEAAETQLAALRVAAEKMVSEPDCLEYPKGDVWGMHEKGDAEAPLWTEAGLYGRVGKEAARTLLAWHRKLRAALSAPAQPTAEHVPEGWMPALTEATGPNTADVRRVVPPVAQPTATAAPSDPRCPDPECGCRTGGYCDRPVRERLVADQTLAKLEARPPRYDAVYFEGVARLDAMARIEIPDPLVDPPAADAPIPVRRGEGELRCPRP